VPGGAQFTQRTFCSDYRTADRLLYQNVVPGTWWTGVAFPYILLGKAKEMKPLPLGITLKGGQARCTVS